MPVTSKQPGLSLSEIQYNDIFNSKTLHLAFGSVQGVHFSVFLHDSRALTESKESQAVPIPSTSD